MRIWLARWMSLVTVLNVINVLLVLNVLNVLTVPTAAGAEPKLALDPAPKKVCIIPIREEITPSLLYLVRRGVKEAIAQQADLLVIDMNTPGGRVSTTRSILEVLNEFKGETVTF